VCKDDFAPIHLAARVANEVSLDVGMNLADSISLSCGPVLLAAGRRMSLNAMAKTPADLGLEAGRFHITRD
jgi:hypothetical protein